jgi:hypothetical protein
MISLQQLEEGINRARSLNPATGSDACLHPEVATLGAIYGEMIFRRLRLLDPVWLEAGQRAMLERWCPSASHR